MSYHFVICKCYWCQRFLSWAQQLGRASVQHLVGVLQWSCFHPVQKQSYSVLPNLSSYSSVSTSFTNAEKHHRNTTDILVARVYPGSHPQVSALVSRNQTLEYLQLWGDVCMCAVRNSGRVKLWGEAGGNEVCADTEVWCCYFYGLGKISKTCSICSDSMN